MFRMYFELYLYQFFLFSLLSLLTCDGRLLNTIEIGEACDMWEYSDSGAPWTMVWGLGNSSTVGAVFAVEPSSLFSIISALVCQYWYVW